MSAFNIDEETLEKIFIIAEDIINEKNGLEIEPLQNELKKKLNLPERTIYDVIQLLLNKRVLVEGSKLTRESVLINPYRKKIYHYLIDNVCAYFTEIKNFIFCNQSSNKGSAGHLIWHLEMLLKFNLIKKIRFETYTIFMPIEVDEEVAVNLFLLKNDLNKNIITLLIKHEKIKKSEVHRHLNENREKIYYHLNKLMEYNIINSNQADNKNIFINPEKIKLINLAIGKNSNENNLKKGGYVNDI
ncbi:MAG: hypothetical protein EAX96_17805 [Candidatus Lokiarchaeota archaeon]|nr:hypothetical protein [Candidatus Lokiarchaeota archaeon]